MKNYCIKSWKLQMIKRTTIHLLNLIKIAIAIQIQNMFLIYSILLGMISLAI